MDAAGHSELGTLCSIFKECMPISSGAVAASVLGCINEELSLCMVRRHSLTRSVCQGIPTP
jgi:hypothetical protein